MDEAADVSLQENCSTSPTKEGCTPSVCVGVWGGGCICGGVCVCGGCGEGGDHVCVRGVEGEGRFITMAYGLGMRLPANLL